LRGVALRCVALRCVALRCVFWYSVHNVHSSEMKLRVDVSNPSKDNFRVYS